MTILDVRMAGFCRLKLTIKHGALQEDWRARVVVSRVVLNESSHQVACHESLAAFVCCGKPPETVASCMVHLERAQDTVFM